MNNFNVIAPFYKGLSILVFGNALLDAQFFFLNKIPSSSKVLVLGGGDGTLLAKIDASVHVDFIELSSVMLARARKQDFRCHVNFILGDESAITDAYDVIITPFVLDCFGHTELTEVIHHLGYFLKSGGYWICTDFNAADKRVRSKILVWLMITFFRIFSGLQAKKLFNFFDLLHQKYKSEQIKFFKGSLIRSELFRKQ